MVIPKLGQGIMLIDGPGEDMPSVPYGKGEVRNVVGLCTGTMLDSDGWRNH